MKGRLGTRAILDEKLALGRAVGLRIEEDKRSGTAVMYDGETAVLRAIQKEGSVWIIMYRDTDNVQWVEEDDVRLQDNAGNVNSIKDRTPRLKGKQ